MLRVCDKFRGGSKHVAEQLFVGEGKPPFSDAIVEAALDLCKWNAGTDRSLDPTATRRCVVFRCSTESA
eukprot:3235619-Lingulodinium_polyedra.AAC.1